MQVIDPFSAAPDKRFYKRDIVNVELVVHDAASLPDGTAEWAAQLVGNNLGGMYKDTWGWDLADKMKDLKHVRLRSAVLPSQKCAYRRAQVVCQACVSPAPLRTHRRPPSRSHDDKSICSITTSLP